MEHVKSNILYKCLESKKLIPSQVHEWCLIQTEQKPLCNNKSIDRYGYRYQTEKQVKYRRAVCRKLKYSPLVYSKISYGLIKIIKLSFIFSVIL